jgi:hypothetical protein
MRARALAVLAAALLMAMGGHAEAAAWKTYVSHALGFSFDAPGVITVTKGKYRGGVAGANDAIIYRSRDNNIDYRATIVDFSNRAGEGSVLMEEAAYILQDGKHVLLNDFGRVEPGKEAVYGRRMTIDLPDNAGRNNVATHFTKGHLYILEAAVLPANGDFTTPDAGRFLDSLAFDLAHTEPGASELTLPK